MTRLKKELEKRGLIFSEDDPIVLMRGSEYDMCQKFVAIDGQFIICVWESAVTDPEFRLYDKNTFKLVAVQNVYPDTTLWGNNTWGSYIFGKEEVG